MMPRMKDPVAEKAQVLVAELAALKVLMLNNRGTDDTRRRIAEIEADPAYQRRITGVDLGGG